MGCTSVSSQFSQVPVRSPGSAQVASLGDLHLHIYKEERDGRAFTSVAELTGEGVGYENLPKRFEGDLSEGDSGGQVVTLQYFLAILSFFNSEIPGPDIDGVFGRGTRQSVLSFQRFAGLEETGTVDRLTWDNIYGAYKGTVDYLESRQLVERVNTEPYPGVVLRRGDVGPSVLTFKTYLNYIASYFFDLMRVAETSIYDVRTQNAVRQFQKIFAIAQTGQVNEATWNAIADVYRILREGQQRLEGQYPGYEIS